VNSEPCLSLFLLVLLPLAVGTVLGGWLVWQHRLPAAAEKTTAPRPLPMHRYFVQLDARTRPECWLAVRTTSTENVRAALGIHRAAPCTWAEGLAGEHEFFISPPVHGWVIVTGQGLPLPSDDVDATFYFLTALSRQLGHVQYFYARRADAHHAWARLDDGCVTRAFAWAETTLWNQGNVTVPETEAGLKLFAYADDAATPAAARHNFERVARLAARWSLDPAEVQGAAAPLASGLAGEAAGT